MRPLTRLGGTKYLSRSAESRVLRQVTKIADLGLPPGASWEPAQTLASRGIIILFRSGR